MLIGHLVAIGCRGISHDVVNRVLRSGPVSDSARDALDAELPGTICGRRLPDR